MVSNDFPLVTRKNLFQYLAKAQARATFIWKGHIYFQVLNIGLKNVLNCC